MFKKILMSGLVLGAVAATVGGATFAGFSNTGTASGTVSSGTVNIEVNGVTNGNAALVIGGLNCPDKDNMAPGDICTAPVTAANNGSLSATWAVSASSDNGCFAAAVAGIPAGDAELGDADADHDPTDSHAGTLSITLADNNGCQGQLNANITVSITATQSPSPHD